MRCEYCDVEVTTYPESGLCPHCSGKLPPKPAAVPIHHSLPFVPGINCCPKCHNTRIVTAKRGFSWWIGIPGFFLIPVFGLLLGFCGSGKPLLKCTNCGHKWQRR